MDKIWNPVTKQFISIYSTYGKKILKNYIHHYLFIQKGSQTAGSSFFIRNQRTDIDINPDRIIIPKRTFIDDKKKEYKIPALYMNDIYNPLLKNVDKIKIYNATGTDITYIVLNKLMKFSMLGYVKISSQDKINENLEAMIIKYNIYKNHESGEPVIGRAKFENYTRFMFENIGPIWLNKFKKKCIKCWTHKQSQPQLCNNNCNNKWIMCDGDCKKNISNFLKTELDSTLYYIMTLANSYINLSNADDSIKFICSNHTNLTGNWENDLAEIFIKFDSMPQTGKRQLVMAYGPSASGKTFTGIQMLTLLKNLNTNFPNMFLFVDGGIMRETSFIYQIFKWAALKQNVYGVKNLVCAGADLFCIPNNIFNSGKIKNKLKKFIENQVHNGTTNYFGLYIPETAAGPSIDNAPKKFKSWIDLLKIQTFTGILIYQHQFPHHCPLNPTFKCESTHVSGTIRQFSEGKKFTSSTWDGAMKNGLADLKTDECVSKWILHNSGSGKRQSVLLSNQKINEDQTVGNWFQNSVVFEGGVNITEIGFNNLNNILQILTQENDLMIPPPLPVIEISSISPLKISPSSGPLSPEDINIIQRNNIKNKRENGFGLFDKE